jgi:hypothetical protein
MRDGHGERPLSEEGHSFRPRFSRDGGAAFYLVAERPGAFLASTGELWSADVRSRVRRRVALSKRDYQPFRRYLFVDTDRNEVLSVTVGGKRMRCSGLTAERPDTYIYVVDPHGRSRRQALAQPVAGLGGSRQTARWLVVEDRTRSAPTVLRSSSTRSEGMRAPDADLRRLLRKVGGGRTLPEHAFSRFLGR